MRHAERSVFNASRLSGSKQALGSERRRSDAPGSNRKEATTTPRKTTTSNEVKDRWKAANYTRVNIYLPKDDAAAYKRMCEEQGLTLSDIPKDAIYKFLRES